MAVAFRANSFINATGGPNVTGTEPAGTVQGDVLVALAIVEGVASGAITAPSGWTTLASGNSTSTNFRYVFAYIVRGVSAPSLVFAYTGTTRYRELDISGFSGVDNTNPIDATAAAVASGSGNRASVTDPPSMTVINANTMAVGVGVHWAGSPSGGWVAPTGYTLRSDNTVGNDCMLATKSLTAAGAENPSAFTCGTAATDDWASYSLALRPALKSLVAHSRARRYPLVRR